MMDLRYSVSIILFLIGVLCSLSSFAFFISPDNIFTLGQLFYHSILVDQKTSSLYVGSKSNLFRLWLYNINDTSSPSLFAHRIFELKKEEKVECLRAGSSDKECDVWIREIFPTKDGQRLFVCSSVAMKPQIGIVNSLNLKDIEEFRTMIGICSQHENINTTAVLVESGNPGDVHSLYSGIRTGLSLENHLIYRPPLTQNGREIHQALRTPIYDTNWLNEPQFVASFDIGQFVYFFFREMVPDIQNQGRSVVSRVARICKSDLGGRNVLRQMWSSFIKARLNCSFTTEAPYFFNYLQSVYKVEQDQSVNEDVKFYMTFTDLLGNSAICAFRLDAINEAFDNSLFLEQSPTGHTVSVTSPDKIPNNRPGTCVSDSRTLTDEDLNFAKVHLLIADTVPGTLVYKSSKILTTILADHVNEIVEVLFVLVPNDMKIIKIAAWKNPANNINSGQLLAVYNLPLKERINDMEILNHEYIFVAQDSQVSQFRLSQCSFYMLCNQCALDPYCSWNIARGECFAHEPLHNSAVGWIANTGNEAAEKCRNYLHSYSKTLYLGDSIHLECLGAMELCESGNCDKVEWKIDQYPVPQENPNHYVFTRDGGLVLMNTTHSMGGMYQCLINKSPTTEYAVRIDEENCTKPRSLQQFQSVQREWCRKLDDYRSNLSKWKDLYEVSKDSIDQKDSVTPVVE